MRGVAAATALVFAVLFGLVVPTGASGDPTLDRLIVVPVASLPQVPIQAATLARISQHENSDVKSIGARATVAGRLYRRGTHSAEVLLARFSGVSGINQALSGAVSSLIGSTCQATVGHSVPDVPVPLVPTGLLVICGRLPNGVTLAQLGFAKGNVLAVVLTTGIAKATLIQAAQRQYQTLPSTAV